MTILRRRRLRAATRSVPLSPQDRVLIAANSAERGRMFFLVAAATAAICAVAAFLSLLSLPPGHGRETVVSGRDPLREIEGPARYAPGRTFGRVARLEENVGFATRVTYVVPVRPVGQRTGTINYFTEVERLAGQRNRFVVLHDGILVSSGLPRELIHLYRWAGIPTADKPALLVRDLGRLRWRPIVLGVQLLFVAALSLGAAFWLRRQARDLRQALHGQPVSDGPAARS